MVRAIAAVIVIALSASAAAQGTPESARLFEEGRALADAQKYEQACAKFEASLGIDRAMGTLINYANCHEKLGHLALAWRLYEEVARESEKAGNAERAKLARERAQALIPKTSTIVLRLADPNIEGLTVKVGDRVAPSAREVREVVDPGDVTVEVSAPNRQTFTKTERAEAGLKLVIEVPALEAIAEVRRDDTPSEGTTRRRRSRVIAASAMVGLGVASAITGSVLAVRGKNEYDLEFELGRCNREPDGVKCDDIGTKNQNDAIRLANIGTGFWIAAGALVAGGAIVFLTAPRDVVVVPTASAESGGLAVVGRF